MARGVMGMAAVSSEFIALDEPMDNHSAFDQNHLLSMLVGRSCFDLPSSGFTALIAGANPTCDIVTMRIEMFCRDRVRLEAAGVAGFDQGLHGQTPSA